MSELTTLARPYAKAVFEAAQAAGNLAGWSDQLGFMAAVAHDPAMRVYLDNPRLTRESAAQTFISVCEGHIDGQGKNLVRMLADNGRIGLLPEIAALFEVMRAGAEGKVEAKVVSARPVADEQKAEIAAALRKRLGRDVELVCEIDENLIGGAVIRAGDLVIDGSMRGRLERLAASLSR
ncbi:F0F1 ATP synthase subunit delta [Thioalkalivibrio denitrificans]|uniref:ATP synthase subunit delta n=1 Tax=Thioalkalivibrio denitrificans TaxID=108003 RepID=A0A1V3NSD5_9GAMM|nr:F0F1 ATP synthase subunit delta [Thioalkalivibrio denitrificans]OOG27873.1 F0F1 ATP synthase subunit delta [Thioalkalivibrio denitrificans]